VGDTFPRDAAATRQRILDAARQEFAEHGVAGGRVDRIAASAKANKAQIYHYFGNKDDLFDAVFAASVDATIRAVPFDATNLADYAARLFDRYDREPDVRRLSTWRRLERGAPHPPLEGIVANNQKDVAAIVDAQRAGQLPARFTAIELLTLVLTIAAMWTSQNPELSAVVRKLPRARRRQVVIDAVRAVLAA
jgi:AcrR family transcriptional regulator